MVLTQATARHAGTAPPLLDLFLSIFPPNLLPQTAPYGKQRRTPATPNSPPLLVVPLLGLLPRGSSMGRCNRQKVGVNGSGFDDVFFRRSKIQSVCSHRWLTDQLQLTTSTGR
ncbi:hypothetical protein CORC01_04075 [Colletotrichum orchidophilum]|uniref:Uncharacterized protein n=1 Tax=Colletotrichum orchidophilum TaxID=1209926 RepID=A0A1G4BHI0_9PEZI|nr:uncharacterized protein CORC01_04075 [Colletotrichum orchidophilum]OHF00758.1 hypothetical protein CORC01_04075 [Colletotrichum orchidophilum]